MPVVVPNSFNQKYNNRYNSINYGYNNMLSNEIDNLMEENETKSHYLNRLENKIRRLENINNIFLNILRENYGINRTMNKSYSYNDLNFGSYPYLSFDNNRNKTLLYLNRNEINNNKIIDGKYKNNYLVPILPKYNSVADNNRLNYLLNNEKLKYFSKDSRNDSRPYFSYNNKYNSMNIPQKINSVQYFNKKIDYKKYNSSSNKINVDINLEKNSKENNLINNNSQNINYNNADIRNEINKLNNNLNERLSKIENLQKMQKKDIDYLMGKSKGSKSENTSKKDSNKNNENKNNNTDKKEEKKEDKKEEKKEDKKDDKKDSDDDDEESDDEEDDEDDEDDDEKEVGIKSISSD